MTNENGVIYRMDDSSSREEWLQKRSRGMGASEMDVMCNKSPWHTPGELFELKAGLRQPSAPTEAMIRGTTLEASVRDRFMSAYGNDFDLEYHPFGMYYRTDYTMLYATLDGVLIAKHNLVRDFGNGQILAMKEGERCILEIKCPAPRDFKTYQEWVSGYPHHYRFQAGGQMFCSGINKQLMIANITGEYQQTQPYDEHYYVINDNELEAEIDEIKVTGPKFWERVTKRQRPDDVIEVADGAPVIFSAKITAGTIWDNLAEAKKSVLAYAKRFEGITFDDDHYKEAKSTRADLNKKRDAIDEVKKGIKKQWNEPYMKFEAECKEMMEAITQVTTPIDNQIKAYEEKMKAHRKVFVDENLDRIVATEYADLKELLEQTGGYTKNPSWYNSSAKITDAQRELRRELDMVRKDLLVLEEARKTVPEDVFLAMDTAYRANGRVIEYALSARAVAENARKAREAKATPQKPIERPQPAEPAPQPTTEQPGPKVYTMTVEFSHTDVMKFQELVEFLKSNGFHCRKIK